MTHITISDRIWGIEVPKDIKNISVNKGLLTDEWRILSDNYSPFYLPPDKTYKFLCLASEANDNPHKFTFIEMSEIAKLDSNKEYALIEVQ